MFSKIFFGLFFITSAFASYDEADKIYGKGSISLSGYRRTIIELVHGGFYFSAVPWMKDYLVKSEGPLERILYAHPGTSPPLQVPT